MAKTKGWEDIDLGHDFHKNKHGIGFTVSEPARREILDCVLALNHERYKEEVAQGLHDKGAAKAKSKPGPNSSKKRKTSTRRNYSNELLPSTRKESYE